MASINKANYDDRRLIKSEFTVQGTLKKAPFFFDGQYDYEAVMIKQEFIDYTLVDWVFLWDDPVRGLWDDAKWDIGGDDYTILNYVYPSNGRYVELFNDNEYISNESTGTLGVNDFTMQSGETLVTKVIYHTGERVRRVQFPFLDMTHLVVEVSRDGGQTWTSDLVATGSSGDSLSVRFTATDEVILSRLEIQIN